MQLKLKQIILSSAISLLSLSAFSQSGQKWAVDGLSPSGTDFLGTNNVFPIVFKTNKIEWMRLSPTGNFGIGINNPMVPLHVAGQIRSNLLGGSGFRLLQTDNLGNIIPVTGGTANQILFGNGTWGEVTTLGWKITGNNMSSTPSGNVGIGVPTPSEKLDVNGNIKANKVITSIFDSPTQKIAFGTHTVIFDLTNNGIYTDNAPLLIQSNPAFNYNTIINAGNTGFVGIRTSTPTQALDVSGNTNISGNATIGQNASIVGTLNTKDMAVTGNALISGNETISGVLTVNTLDLTGPLSATNLVLSGNSNVAGNATVGGNIFTNDITASGNLTTNNLAVTGALSAPGFSTSGNVSANCLASVSLNVSGQATADNLLVNNTFQTNNILTSQIGSSTNDVINFGTNNVVSINTATGNTSIEGKLDVGGLKIPGFGGLEQGTHSLDVDVEGNLVVGPLRWDQNTLALGPCGSTLYSGTAYDPSWVPTVVANQNKPIMYLCSPNAFVGIGNTNPEAKLDLTATGPDYAMAFRVKANHNNTMAISVNGKDDVTNFLVYGNGEVFARDVTVMVGPFPDYVFEKNYKLMPLKDLENYINVNKHLPNIPTAKEVSNFGLSIGETQTKLIEKVEELTLYMIELKKENDALKAKVEKLENK